MPQTLGQNWQDVNDAALGPIGSAARETDASIFSRLSQHVDAPLRMFATFPTPDAKLNFSANRTVAGDGASKSTPAIDDLASAFAASTIDFQTGATTGGTFLREGAAFSIPSLTNANYYRVVFVYRSDNSVDCKFSSGYASWAAMDAAAEANPGQLFAALEGIPVGWIDMVATSTTALKSASSAGVSATPVVENAVSGASSIFRIAAGGGAGGGAVKDFKIQAVTGDVATVKGGYLILDDGRELATWDGVGGASTDFGKDITVDCDAVAVAQGLSPATSTNYALCIDLSTLSAPVTFSDNGRIVYAVTQANFKLILASSDFSRGRYVPIGFVFNGPSGIITRFGTYAVRTHDTLADYFPYLERYESPQQTTVSASIPLSHGLSGKPQLVQVFYYDGAKEIDVTDDALIDRTSSQVIISTLGLTFGGTQYVEVKAFFLPPYPNVASVSRTFSSAWYTTTAVTTVAHGLSDMEDIRGYAVQEWDTTTGRRRQIDPSALVVNFDDVNFYLNWSGLTPSATLRYRVVAGGSPLPWSIPTSEEYDVTFTAEPSWPIAHGLSGVPTSIRALQEVAANEWQPINLQGHVTATSSQLLGSLAAFSPGVSPARVRLIATISR